MIKTVKSTTEGSNDEPISFVKYNLPIARRKKSVKYKKSKHSV